MSIGNRKIGIYSIELVDIEDSDDRHKPGELLEVIKYIMRKNGKDRIHDQPLSKKFHFLDNYSRKADYVNLLFKSAKYHHRPPLVNKDNANERDNPKVITEGEGERTHVCFLIKSDEIIAALEERKHGITMKKIIKYLSKWIINKATEEDDDAKYYLDYLYYSGEDFLRMLNNMNRVIETEVFVDKKAIGSEFLNISDRRNEVKEEVTITIKSKKSRSIKETAIDAFKRFTKSNSLIQRVRVRGADDNGDKFLLDTETSRKIQYAKVEIDEITGLPDTQELFQQMRILLRDFR